jgi:hypothetical protein
MINPIALADCAPVTMQLGPLASASSFMAIGTR